MKFNIFFVFYMVTFSCLVACSKDEETPAPQPEPCTATPPQAPGQAGDFFFRGELLMTSSNFELSVTGGCNPQFFVNKYTFPGGTDGYYAFGIEETDQDKAILRKLELGTIVGDINDPGLVYDLFSEGKKTIANRPGIEGFFMLFTLPGDFRITSTKNEQEPGFFRINKRSAIQQRADGTEPWFDIQGDFDMTIRQESTGATDRFRGSFSLRVMLLE